MSFYNSNGSPCFGGQQNSNERMLISVKKVFDAGIKQLIMDNTTLQLTDATPPVFAPPLTYISCRNSQSNGQMRNLTVVPIADGSRNTRIRCEIVVPLTVTYEDANHQRGSGYAELVLPQDVVLAVPEPSIIPYAIEVIVNCAAPCGRYVGGLTFALDLYTTLVFKTVIDADIIVPTFGYARFPALKDFDCQNSYFDLPLFPPKRK